MHTPKSLMSLSACLLAFCLVAVSVSPAVAQSKMQENPGGYHGELDFPFNWKRYYTYAEWTQIMHDMQDQYSHLADIESIGKSRMGRDQFLITITAKSTGDHSEKPAMWVDGAIHGNEVNGIMCGLYSMWYLLTRYDYDPFVHDLLNNTTFYILPGLNVDANASFVSFPNTPNNPREPYRPEDNDGDGLYDEDQTEDVDGDGELSTMYVEDPDGPLKLSADERRFVDITDEAENVLRFRRIGSEGYDNDGDGRINEDDIGGPDPNRNFPYGWNMDAGNPYPMSEVETRNVYEFQRTHPNIFASFHYHNTGRLIMFQAPLPVEAGAARQAAPGGMGGFRRGPQLTFEQRLAQLQEDNKYAQLFDRQVAPEYQHDMDVQTEIVTMGARILKNYRPTMAGLTGQAPASTYHMLGAYSYLIELWGSPAFAADQNDDGRVDQEETLLWIDTELMGEGWIVPHKVNHPDLGEVWIGGSQKKHTQRTPPARYIEMEAQKNSDFVLYCASQFPKVAVADITVRPAADSLYWIEAAVKNDRVYPTASDRAQQLKLIEKDKIMLTTSNNVSLIDIPKGSAAIDPANPNAQVEVITKKGTEFWLKGKQTLRFGALVKMDGSQGWIEIQVKSQNGGTDTKRINIKIQ
ncbi:MAG: hypothetical protein KAJ42_05190 [Gemmatimonadetes bacterium]|nr:hypothetical protein [Gemmatimonadota bacterium]